MHHNYYFINFIIPRSPTATTHFNIYDIYSFNTRTILYTYRYPLLLRCFLEGDSDLYSLKPFLPLPIYTSKNNERLDLFNRTMKLTMKDDEYFQLYLYLQSTSNASNTSCIYDALQSYT